MPWNWSADNINALADSALGAGGAIPGVGDVTAELLFQHGIQFNDLPSWHE